MTSRMSVAELLDLAEAAPTVSLPIAGRALGIGSNLAYEAASRGEFPCRVIKVGRKLRVPTADLLATLGIEPRRPASDGGVEAAAS